VLTVNTASTVTLTNVFQNLKTGNEHLCASLARRHDTYHNNTELNDIQCNDTQHKGFICDTRHLRQLSKQHSALILSVVMLSVAFYLLLC
jgi:hypothetical protein